MNGIARSGRLASRALRLIPSSFPTSSATFLLPRRLPTKIGTSSFSSIARYQQYNQAQYATNDNYGESAGAGDFGAEDISNIDREFSTFAELGEAGVIDPRVIDTLVNRMGIHTMTEVQRMTINECLDGTDVIAQARTGTGKTLAFLMPIVQRLLRDPKVSGSRPHISDTRALIISPTRELAEQIAVEAKKIVQGTGVQVQTAVGGTQKSHHLRLMQQQGCHILVGTPGRVKDLLSDPYSGVRLDNIQTFVLDEADRLLDIGFGPEITEMQRYMPPRSERDRQTLMFSATIPRSVVGIVKDTMKPDFKFVRTVDPEEAATHEKVPQRVIYVPGLQNQIPAIVELAQNAIEEHKRSPQENVPFKAIIFYSSVSEVHLAHEILSNLRDPTEKGGMFASHPLSPCKIYCMSSQLDQRQRTMNSEGFRRAESGILISTDVSARGMDFPNVSHVIQVGLPRSTEDYVHRLGRTGRAGKGGKGYVILVDDERYEMQRLQRQINAHNFAEEKLATASLDMTQPSQLAPETARIMQMVQTGVNSTSRSAKAKAYQVLLGALAQSPVRRSKQQIVDLANANAQYGWGMEKPPTVSSAFVTKGGFNGVRGLEVGEDYGAGERRGMRGGSRGGFGGSRDRDQFGGSSRDSGFGGRDSGYRSRGNGFGGRSGGRGGSRGGEGFGRSNGDEW